MRQFIERVQLLVRRTVALVKYCASCAAAAALLSFWVSGTVVVWLRIRWLSEAYPGGRDAVAALSDGTNTNVVGDLIGGAIISGFFGGTIGAGLLRVVEDLFAPDWIGKPVATFKISLIVSAWFGILGWISTSAVLGSQGLPRSDAIYGFLFAALIGMLIGTNLGLAVAEPRPSAFPSPRLRNTLVLRLYRDRVKLSWLELGCCCFYAVCLALLLIMLNSLLGLIDTLPRPGGVAGEPWCRSESVVASLAAFTWLLLCVWSRRDVFTGAKMPDTDEVMSWWLATENTSVGRSNEL
jgi:hypothetical protein